MDYNTPTFEELSAHIGKKVIYRGAWGHDDPEFAILKNVEYEASKGGRIVADLECEDGDLHWGYNYQIEFID
jgi:hypothetical protein